MENYPYATEYAKSNRSSCKSCKNSISKDSLRMAIMVQSPHFDGKVPNWFHFDCFFTKYKGVNVESIKDFNSLRWDDQEKIRAQLDPAQNVTQHDYSIEYAKSNRSQCGKCNEKIDKLDIRFSRLEDNGDKPAVIGPLKRWYHIPCILEMKDDILKCVPDFEIEKIEGFAKLKDEDKPELVKKFKSWKSKKRSNSNTKNAVSSKKQKMDNDDINTKLKEQNEKIWNLRDKLTKEVSKKAMADLLKHNRQYIPKGDSNVVESLSDKMLFGCLGPCEECGGFLSFSDNVYKCQSMIDEWIHCSFKTRQIKRSAFIVPNDYCDADILKNYIYIPNERLLPPEEISKESIQPLRGYSIIVDKIPLDKNYTSANVKKRIKELGGQVVSKINSTTLLLISSKSPISSKGKSLTDMAQEKSMDVVSADFLDNLDKGKLYDVIKKFSIVNWGRSHEEFAKLNSATSKKSTEKNSNAKEKELMQVMTVKGGAAVDPDSKLEHKAHLYQDPKTMDPLNAVLGMTDLVRGSNSFYKLQLLESDTKKKWWVFRSWGRIGTTIGGNKLEKFDDLQEAIDNFRALYLEKTGNDWKNRHKFQKQPNKFNPIEVDYGEEAKKMNLAVEKSESKLPLALQNLIRFIFDMASMKKAMLEFEIDLNRMPLGKLSKNQIDKSYEVLKKLQDVLKQTEVSKNMILTLSNQFYTMMPHNFGMKTPPLIDSLEMVKDKCEMISSLLEMEVAYKLMEVDEGLNSIDSQYEKIHSCIKPLDKSSDEYKRLETYLQNTHAPTHDWKIKVINIFDVSREGEYDRFQSFKHLPNRMMLWHGSRRTNWAGILSQGLRIAPPEAPVSGYMFGKGIYFADMVSKSAQYCHTSADCSEGLLLLCEVALGTMTERLKADSEIKLKKNQHSCKGVGETHCDPTGNYIDEDGVIYPMGKPVKQKVKSALLYNEYIVYNVAQVRQRYLFKVKFDYC